MIFHCIQLEGKNRCIRLNQMVADSERKKKELILHIMYNFCVICSGSICHKPLLLRKLLRHKFLATGTVFWGNIMTGYFCFVFFPKHLLLTAIGDLVLG